MQTPVSHHADSDLRTCDACSTRVHRDDVHKNRYGQYICRTCRRDGVRAVGRKRWRHLLQSMPTTLLSFLILLLVITVGTVTVMVLMQAHTYSNTGMMGDLKSLLRSINGLVR